MMNIANAAGVHKLSTSSEVHDLYHANAPFYCFGGRHKLKSLQLQLGKKKNKMFVALSVFFVWTYKKHINSVDR